MVKKSQLKTYSDFLKPLFSVGNIDFHYLCHWEGRGHIFGIVINGKEQWQLYISEKGKSVKVHKEGKK